MNDNIQEGRKDTASNDGVDRNHHRFKKQPKLRFIRDFVLVMNTIGVIFLVVYVLTFQDKTNPTGSSNDFSGSLVGIIKDLNQINQSISDISSLKLDSPNVNLLPGRTTIDVPVVAGVRRFIGLNMQSGDFFKTTLGETQTNDLDSAFKVEFNQDGFIMIRSVVLAYHQNCNEYNFKFSSLDFDDEGCNMLTMSNLPPDGIMINNGKGSQYLTSTCLMRVRKSTRYIIRQESGLGCNSLKLSLLNLRFYK